jgi:hypothetical protein
MTIEHPDLVDRFGLVVCGAVVEHVKQPFDAAASITNLIRPGGHLSFGVPWVWGYHAVPEDYWRYSIAGIREIFPDIEWLEWWHSGTRGKFGIKLNQADQEKSAFRISLQNDMPQNFGELLSDGAMPYLNIAAIGRRPA